MFDDPIYQDRILDHYEQPFHRGACPFATHCHEATNPLCGDRIRIELRVDADGRIEDAFFQGDGCCVSQSAASMLVEHCQGKKVDAVRSLQPKDMLALFAAPLTISRQKCCLLCWKVLQAALVCPLVAGSPRAAMTGVNTSVSMPGPPNV
jgi:nitrogen fixation protein NifU and related proteins